MHETEEKRMKTKQMMNDKRNDKQNDKRNEDETKRNETRTKTKRNKNETKRRRNETLSLCLCVETAQSETNECVACHVGGGGQIPDVIKTAG
jgi:hypothetical protein